MAFGGLKGTLTGNANSITNPFAATGSVAVAVGDLVYAVLGQQTNLTVTACSDNLGNTYTATQVGLDAGTATGRAFYSRVTVAGTLTSVSATTTGSTNDVAFLAAVIEGPFELVPLDTNPTNISSDITSPFTCPATGTRGQDRGVVIAWGAAASGTVWAATSPNLLAGNVNNSTTIKVAIGYQAVTNTTTVSPAFTAAANPGSAVLGTTSFRRSRALIDTGSILTLSSVAPAVVQTTGVVVPPQGNLALSTVAPTVLVNVHINITPASGNAVLSSAAPTVVASANSNRQPAAGHLLLNNWITDETGDPILDENDDPVLDAAANAPTAVLTTHTQILPPAGDIVISSSIPFVDPKSPPQGNILLSTTAPDVSTVGSPGVVPAAANLLLSTFAPAVAKSISPFAAQLLLNNWILDETGDPILDENSDPVLDEAANAPSVAQTFAVNVPAVGNLTLSSDAPTVTLSGHVTITPAQGNLFINLTVLTDEFGVPLTDEDGNVLTIDDDLSAPTVVRTAFTAVIPAAANLLLSSVAPTLGVTESPNVIPASGNLVLSSAAPVVAQSAHIAVSPTAANLTLSSAAAAVVQTTTVAAVPSAANITLSSTAPTVAAGGLVSVSPAVRELVLTSVAPSVAVSVNWNITPAAANIALSAAAPAVAQTEHHAIVPIAGNLSVSSTSPQLQAGGSVSIVPNFAPLTLSTVAPSAAVSNHLNVEPEDALLALTGYEPVVFQVTTDDISPAAGSLVISPTAPTVDATFAANVFPAAGQLQTSAAAPAVQAGGNRSIVPNFAELALTSSAPTVSISVNRNVTPAQADLALSGFVPVLVQTANVITPAAGSLAITGATPSLTMTLRRAVHGSRRTRTHARRPLPNFATRKNIATGTRNNKQGNIS